MNEKSCTGQVPGNAHSPSSFKTQNLAGALLLALTSYSTGAQATIVFFNVDKEMTIRADYDIYQMQKGSTLTTNGRQLEGAYAIEGSTLNLTPGTLLLRAGARATDGSTVIANGVSMVNDGSYGYFAALDVQYDSVATVRNSTIQSALQYAVNADRGAQLTLIDSEVTGQMGIRVAGAATTLDLVNTQVTARGGSINPEFDAGLLLVSGGTINLSAGTVVTGATNGIMMLGIPAAPTTLIIDDSTVTTTSGAGIAMGGLLGGPASANIVLRNGSLLTSDAGIAMLMDSGSTASVAVDNAHIKGNISLSDANTAAVFTLNQGLVTGDISATAGSSVVVNAGGGSQLLGNVDASGASTVALNLASSRMEGNVTSDGTGSTSVQMSGSQLTGNLLNVDSLTLASSVLNGNISNDGATTTTVHATDSQVNGNLLNVTSLALDASALNGTISAHGMAAQAQLTGSDWIGTGVASNGGNLQVNLARSTVVGDLTADTSSQASVVMTDGSSLKGTLTNIASANLSDSTWQVTGDSSVGTLALADGTVALGDAGQFYRLSLASLSGTGTFQLSVDFARELASFVDVSGTATGDYKLLVSARGEDPAADNSLQVVHTGTGSTAQFSLLGGPVDMGTYSYELMQRGTDWFLDTSTRTISPETATVLALFNTAPTVWYGELSTLRSRMGELRYNGAQPGFWMRAYGNKYNVTTSTDVSYKQTQQGLSFGADAPLPMGDGNWLVGLMGGYSDSSLDLSHGTSGSVDSYYLGAYATWLNPDNGYYFDGVLKFNRFQNDATVRMSDGTRAKGNYDNSGVGTSLEFGRHIAVADDYFVEPYAQLAGVAISGRDYTMDNGMRAEGDMTHSLLGKVGTTLGRTIALDNGMVQPYVRVALAHEFAQSNRVQVNGNAFNNDLSGSRGEVGTGVAVSMNKHLQLHVDLDYSNGKNIEQPWGANLGLRYSF